MSLVCRLSVAAVLVAKSFDAVVVCDDADCSAACCANALVVDVAACCCAPTEELVAKLLVVPVEAPKLELSARFEALCAFAPKAALLVRLAFAVKEPVELDEELPWLAWLEVALPAMPLPVVAAFELLLPTVLALPPPLLDGLLNEVPLPAVAVSFLLPDEAASCALPDELEEPWLAPLWLEFAARLPEAARSSLALTAPLEE